MEEDQKSSIDGYYMAVGTSGNQFKNAPVAGRIMAALVAQNDTDHDLTPIHINLDYIGYDLNIGNFSRLREINPESSFSVLG